MVFVSPSHPQLQRSDGSYALGVCDNDVKIIYLNSMLEPSMVEKVLTHEITHAAMFSYNVNLSWKQEEIVAMLMDTYGHEIINLTNHFFQKFNPQ